MKLKSSQMEKDEIAGRQAKREQADDFADILDEVIEYKRAKLEDDH
ncbi:hypothetical protein [Paenibacillus sp. BIHB 4019]|nr:hypothetical protein [Paenibacillus sp. BIHB 4019]